MSLVTEVSSAKCFGGLQKVFKHDSKELKCQMNFSIFLPPKVLDGKKAPVLYWLSGLTCTEQNFIIKSGFQRYAAESGLIVVGPDTSPRGVDIPGQDDDWDFGSGAGFYVNATQPSWKEHYRMYSYVTEELPSLIESQFSDYVLPGRKSISGHSMGGHGALICSLKNAGAYISVSAFAPINNPSRVPWGMKAFKGYLGGEVGEDGSIPDSWKEWDATFLAAAYTGPHLQLLVDQGSSDPYLSEQLDGKNFISSCAEANLPLVYRIQDGYDHGYFFVSTFIEEHIQHHAKWLYG